MTLEHTIRLIAGTFILVSLGLSVWVSPKFLWFTAFVGANLIQSSFTKWCLMEDILVKLGWQKTALVPAPVKDASAPRQHRDCCG
ncbi:MAG: DUF2892 domain-containing protein [Elusimicrobia bacterium]|nr:DUF2892 domain-containing protein [Elusimicrobiota bacterium]